MSQTKKRNIIIGSLCAIVLLMVVGYAAFSTVLKINGTSNITSNWDIKITNIKSNVLKGNASNASEPTGVNTLTASFETDLVSPGDSMEYTITVTNNGSLKANLEKITMSEPDNEYVTFTASINGEEVNAGENTEFTEVTKTLNAGESKDIKVTVTFKDATISKMEQTTSNLTITLDYAQADGNGAVVTPNNVVYRKTADILNIGDSIEGIQTTTDYNTLNSSIFIKHTIDNNVINQTELCFIKDENLHCLMGGDNGTAYESNKQMLLNLFDNENTFACVPLHDTYTECYISPLTVVVHNDGLMATSYNSENCIILQDGSSFCE